MSRRPRRSIFPDLPPFVHIRQNVYLVKRPKTDSEEEEEQGCECGGRAERQQKKQRGSGSCPGDGGGGEEQEHGHVGNMCEDCICRWQNIACSSACRCHAGCCNRPFEKEKSMEIRKTESCGWGAFAAEPIKGGDFIVEYAGEVIDDAICEERLWALKQQSGSQLSAFYLCEISRNLVIDAAEKGSLARFLNHSCDPNARMEKWKVRGETRVGIFAARDIEVGEELTYDYQFIGFGEAQPCHCGSKKCRKQIGTKSLMLQSLENETKSSPATRPAQNLTLTEDMTCTNLTADDKSVEVSSAGCSKLPDLPRFWGRTQQRSNQKKDKCRVRNDTCLEEDEASIMAKFPVSLLQRFCVASTRPAYKMLLIKS